MTTCYCWGGDPHEHRPNGGGARIMACPPEPAPQICVCLPTEPYCGAWDCIHKPTVIGGER